ncbi:alpha/beta hydrolase family protein [Corynebacterium sp. TAE3-ERU12]|uniref:alpha/beta hydrolase n=1 Tax=Corynebacterium sp. TAE3-ERU12 TaxID=2849491 RepID=UPI001C436BEE|nr:alpha/beta hydrolase [Corynebacterium sp. TAE3-ERU12]MBV7296010.1 alpha/beta hydrolase family protein [Corynebacterium sp. TAE3-ERU12]
MGLTVPVASTWHADAALGAAQQWFDQAARLRKIAERIEHALAHIPDTDFSGDLRVAVHQRIRAEVDRLRFRAYRMTLIADALGDCGVGWWSADDLRATVSRAVSQGLTVADNGVVTPGARTITAAFIGAAGGFSGGLPGVSGAAAVAPLLTLCAAHTATIRRLLAYLDDTDTTTAAKLRAGGPDTDVLDAAAVRDDAAGLAWSAARAGGELLAIVDEQTALIGFGDLDGAEHIVVLVPGTGSDLQDHDSLATQAERAHALLGSTTRPTAVVVAMHNAPQHLLAAAGDSYYPAAADQVRMAAARVSAARPDTPLSVVGYSHGATVAAQATRGPGLRADALCLVAAPGVGPGVHNTGHMKLVDAGGKATAGAPSRVFSERAAEDPIRYPASIHIHGADPEDPDFRAGDAGPAGGVAESGSHGSYFEDPVRAKGIMRTLEDAVDRSR